MLSENKEHTIMIASTIHELPEKIRKFYDYIDASSEIDYYSYVNDDEIMLVNKAGNEQCFRLELLSQFGNIDNEGILWM